VADALLAPVAGRYAAYLIEPQAGLCMALTEEQAIPPPSRADQQMLAARSDGAETPAAATGNPTVGGSLRVSAVGPPSAELAASGMPPGRYLVVVLLQDVPDADAARRAAAGVARALLSGG
jgi:hypothetical protein